MCVRIESFNNRIFDEFLIAEQKNCSVEQHSVQGEVEKLAEMSQLIKKSYSLSNGSSSQLNSDSEDSSCILRTGYEHLPADFHAADELTVQLK